MNIRPFLTPARRPLSRLVVPGMAALASIALLLPRPAAAQEGEALRYELRDAEPPATQALTPGAEEEVPVPDVSGDRTPEQVIQGAGLALRGPLDEALTWESASLRMLDDAPASEGPGGMLVRAWPALRDEVTYETVEVSVRRGDRDETIAGREAAHHVLEARLLRHHERRSHHFRITADLWVLEDLPFSWVPFGAHSTSVAAYDPRLREAMAAELEALGLVARAVTLVDYELLSEGDTPGDPSNSGSKSVKAFEIAELTRVPAPERPDAPLVDAGFPDRLQAAVMDRPGEICRGAAAGEAPALVEEEVPEGHRAGVVSWVAEMCEGQPHRLFFGILMEEAEAAGDWTPICDRAVLDEGPEAFARSVFSGEKAGAFLELVPAEDQARFLAQVRPACEREGSSRGEG